MYHPHFNRIIKNARAVMIDGTGNIKHVPYDQACWYMTPRKLSVCLSARLNEDREPDPKGKRHVLIKMSPDNFRG